VFQIDDHTLTSLRRQIEGLARIVEDLRVVSLAESNHLDLQLEAVDLSQEIGALREIVQPSLSAAGFEAQWRLEPALAVCDPTRLRQAALALLENARRHAVPGPLVIRTATFGAFARISIEDSGPGIDADRAAHIFHPFKRDPSATGSGLGLAVVRAIAEAHGGLALHRNTVAGGSLFTVEIPRQPARRPAV